MRREFGKWGIGKDAGACGRGVICGNIQVFARINWSEQETPSVKLPSVPTESRTMYLLSR
jgi:hypothetical protein